ncbi:MAG TPA: hypothetical protein VIH05_02110 [Tepidiformaceae bacterium]
MNGVTRPQLWPEIRVVLLAAMAIFTYTIVIGILNGTDIVDFDRRRILGHVHGGTLGWLTLAVFAASFWLFGESAPISARERQVVRGLAGLAIVSFVCYVAAFSLTYGWWRPILGIASSAAIVGIFAWVLTRAGKTVLGVPHWGFLAALGTSVVGGVLGVLLGLEIATGNNFLPDGGEDAHPATMVVGFLIPVALAMSEWAFSFPHPPKATRAGVIQMVFPFLGGVFLMLSLLLDVVALAPVAILLELIGVVIFLVRMWPSFRRVDWMLPLPGRYAVLSAVSVMFVIGLAQYWVIKYEGDFDLVPTNQLLGLDHSQFIGAMTNSVFAMLLAATMAGGRGRRIDHLIFVLVNVGIIGFVAGLEFDVTWLKRIFAPTMGTGLLIGLAVFAARVFGAGAVEPAGSPREALATGD